MRATAPTPLFGFNSTVHRRGLSFHVQTEDSGVGHPHVITHVFAEGGRIVATRRTSYAEHVAAPDCHDLVRRLLLGQHRDAIVALQAGEFDDVLAWLPEPAEVDLEPTEVRAPEPAANGRAAPPRAAGPALIGLDPTSESLDDVILRDVVLQIAAVGPAHETANET